MALVKTKTIAGYDYEYWRIFVIYSNMNSNQTLIRIALYKDQDTRDANVMDFITHECVTFDETDLTREQAYNKIKENVMSERTPDWDACHIGEEFIPTETNWFADARDA